MSETTSPENENVVATMSPSDRQFDVLPGMSLLESGLAAGVALPFGCANGSCGDCQANILHGQVEKIRNHDFTLTESQKLNGLCLLCSNTATTDVQIEVIEATSVEDISQQELQAKPCRVEHGNNVSIVAFKFVRGKALRFLPGQRAELKLDNGEILDLPISSCPCNAQYVEFHVHASLSQHKTLTSKRVNIAGPHGSFTLSRAIKKPKVFIAEGLAFRQLQGMIEQVLNSDMGTHCCLLWKASADTAHYRSNLCRSWSDAFDEFEFLALDSNDDAIAALPDSWREQLGRCEFYLGNRDDEIVRQLISAGVSHVSIFHP